MNEKRKPGRMPGQRVGALYRSVSWYLEPLEVGERHYFEADLSEIHTKVKSVSILANHRQTERLEGRKHSVTMMTAVRSKGLGGHRYLICVERIK